jgi:hypothetical protein
MAYQYDELGNVIGQYESEEERRRREQANQPVKQTITYNPDGTQEMTIKGTPEALSPVNPNTPTLSQPSMASQPAPQQSRESQRLAILQSEQANIQKQLQTTQDPAMIARLQRDNQAVQNEIMRGQGVKTPSVAQTMGKAVSNLIPLAQAGTVPQQPKPISPAELAQQPAPRPQPQPQTTQPSMYSLGTGMGQPGLRAPQPTPSMVPDSSMYIQQYVGMQDDPQKLIQYGFSETTPEPLRNRAKSRAAELITQQQGQQEAQQRLATMTETDLAKAMREKTTGGSYLKAIMFGMLGMENSALAEAAKLGIGKEQSVMLSDGTPAIIKVASNGTPISGYNATTGAKLSNSELIAAQAGASSKLNIVGGTFINDTTGEVGRVITDEKTGQSYIQTDKGRKPMTGFRPQASTGSLADQRTRMVQEINLKLQGKTAEEKKAILRPYNQQLVASGYPAISPQEVGISSPQISAGTTQAPAPATTQATPTTPVSPATVAPAQAPVGGPSVPGTVAPPAGQRPTGPQLAASAEALKTESEVVGKDLGEKRINLGKSESNADYLITKVNELVTHPGFSVSVGATVQPGFQLIPGTDKASWYTRFEEVKGQAFLQAVQELRGMGALSNQEGDAATKAIQRMSTSQSEKEFKMAADDFQGIIQRGIDRNRVKLGQQPKYGTPEASQQTKQPTTQSTPGKVRKYNPATGQLE